MAILRVGTTLLRRAQCRSPSCWSTTESERASWGRALTFWNRTCSTNRLRPTFEIVSRVNVDCCVVNRNVHSTVPVGPAVGHAVLPVAVSFSCDAPFRPFVSRRSNSSHNSNTNNNTALWNWRMEYFCACCFVGSVLCGCVLLFEWKITWKIHRERLEPVHHRCWRGTPMLAECQELHRPMLRFGRVLYAALCCRVLEHINGRATISEWYYSVQVI